MDKETLKQTAKKIRIDTINMIADSGHGHIGGSLSCADILAVLYFSRMRIDPKNPSLEDRDRFILSKGHAAPVLYAALSRRGYFPQEQLKTLHKFGSILQAHPDMKLTPGVDMSTGSLGQGLSVGNGMALSARLHKRDYRVYVILGDGEINEGQVWEAAMTSSHYKIDNITAILDYNGLQIDGTNEEVMNTSPIDEKFEAFGWKVIKIDGHDISQIQEALDEAQNTKGRPTIIIAKTIKGRGVSFMENRVEWHGTAPNEEQRQIALKCLGEVE